MPLFAFASPKGAKNSGNTLAEYSLIIALVAICSIAGLSRLGFSVANVFSHMLDKDTKPLVVANQLTADSVNAEADSASTMINRQTEVLPFNTEASDVLIQTVGVNGDIDQVNHNSAQLLALAKQYEDSDPQISNALIILGQKGQSIAQAMQQGQKQGVTDAMADFLGYYSGVVVRSSDVFAQLSAQDQSLVRALSNQNIQLSSERVGHTIYGSSSQQLDSYTPGATSTAAAANQVNGNSTQIKQCGQNLKCD